MAVAQTPAAVREFRDPAVLDPDVTLVTRHPGAVNDGAALDVDVVPSHVLCPLFGPEAELPEGTSRSW